MMRPHGDKRYSRLWLGFVVACSLLTPLWAAYSDAPLRFRHLNSRQGLPQNSVLALTQDADGFIWIATQTGLHRYDGYGFQSQLRDSSNPKSLPSNLVTELKAAADGTLWVASFPGNISQFHPATGIFDNYKISSADGNARRFIRQLAVQGSTVWAATDNGLFVLQPQQSRIKQFKLPATFGNNIRAILTVSPHELWVVTQRGLILLDTDTGTQLSAFKAELPANEMLFSARLAGNGIWLGTDNGRLLRYRIRQPSLRSVWALPKKLTLPSRSIVSIVLDHQTLWLGTETQGLWRYNLKSKRSRRFVHNEQNRTSLASNNIRALLLDDSGLLWVGTADHGVDRSRAQNGQFDLFVESASATEPKVNNDVRAITSGRKGVLWLGSNSGEIRRFDPATHHYTHYRPTHFKKQHSRGLGPAILVPVSNGHLLYGSRVGLWDFNIKKGLFLPASLTDDQGQNGGAPLSAARDTKGNWWLGSSQQGVGRYDPRTRRVTWFPVPHEILSQVSNFILSLSAASDNTLWVGSGNGLARFDPVTQHYQPITIRGQDGNPIRIVVRSLYSTRDGTLWVGTLSGVFSVTRHQGHWQIETPFADIAALKGNIFSFQADRQGNLWISSNRGITKVSRQSGKYRHFDAENGLQRDEFNGGVSMRSADGRLWFGGMSGVNAFYPDRIKPSTYKPQVWVTAYQIGNKRVAVTDPADFGSLDMPYNSGLLRLQFASLDFTAPERNRYRIRLEGSQDRWVELGHAHEISYTLLPTGSYSLHIMGSNHDGIWNPDHPSLQINVLPPGWRTQRAYLAYVVFGSLLLALIWYWREYRRRNHRQYLEALSMSRKQLDWALWGSGDGLWVWDLRYNTVRRQGLGRLLGYTEEEVSDPHSHLDWLIHPDDLEKTYALVTRHIESSSDGQFETEYRMHAANGQWRWMLDRGKIVERNQDGSAMVIAGTYRDITEQKRVAAEVQLASLVIQNMAEMVIVTDAEFKVLSVNPAFSHSMNYPAREVVGQDLSSISAARADKRIFKRVRNQLFKVDHWQGELWLMDSNQRELLCWVELTLIRNNDLSVRHVVAVATDITEKKRAEEELRYLANYDPLTRLPNRTLFFDRLQHSLLQAERQHSQVALLFIDLDNFKNINDSLGHDVGDELLKQAAKCMGTCVRKDDTVSRLGGDEFTVILENIRSSSAVCQIAEKILNGFSTPLEIEQRQVAITPSIGISLYPSDATDAQALIKFADTAMYYAKSQGRNTYQFYADEMNKHALRRLELEGHLRQALDKNELYLLYQPKLSLETELITGVEALIRWRNPELGEVLPEEFIYLAEETGIIDQIGAWVIRTAAEQAIAWEKAGIGSINVAVNLSARQFRQENLATQIETLLSNAGLSPANMTLEITESLLMEYRDNAIEQLLALKAIGMQVAIDDFGTGYSSLSYLKRFPIDYLKIDRSFVRDIIDDRDDAAITAAIIGLAHNLDLKVIAEGVESGAQLVFLRASGCEEIQGYLLSPPTSADNIGRLIKESSQDSILAGLN